MASTSLWVSAVLAVGALLASPPVILRAESAGAPFVTVHPVIREALKRIAKGSPSWRESLGGLASSGRRAVILTPDEVVVHHAATGVVGSFDKSDMAEVAPVADGAGRIASVLVVVNVERLRDLHERRGSLPGEFLADLDRVLAHEVYGHAVPYLLAGHVSGRCADALPGQPATDACAIRRENVVRAELGLGRRTDNAFASLAVAWSLRH